MGSALNSQVMFGEGLPLVTHAKRAEEPGEISWSVRPSKIETGSEEEKSENYHEVLDPSPRPIPPAPMVVLFLPRTFTV